MPPLFDPARTVIGLAIRLAPGDPDPSTRDPAQVRSAADKILSRAEFGRRDKPWLTRAREWVADKISSALRWFFERFAPSSAGGSAIVGWVAIAVLAAGVVFVLYRLYRSRTPKEAVAEARRARIDVEPPRTSGQWLVDSLAHERAGEWRDASRCRYRWMIATLVERDVLDEVPGHTTGEERRAVAVTAPSLSTAFDEASERFDVAWYGDRETTEADHVALRSLVEHIIATAARPSAEVAAP
ncbi:MAG: DUF4129 domain-containing protein [Acidimicrobiia bacterium]